MGIRTMIGQTFWVALSQSRKGRGRDRAGLLPLPTTSPETKPDRILSLRCASACAGACACDCLFSQVGRRSYPSFESITSYLIIKYRIQVACSHRALLPTLTNITTTRLPRPKPESPVTACKQKKESRQRPNPPPVNHKLHRFLNLTLKAYTILSWTGW